VNTSYSSPVPQDRSTNQITSAVRTHFPHLQTIAERGEKPTQRPFTAPDSQLESLLALVPPRRELPFRKDGSHAGSSRPSSSSVDLPPLPRPSFSEKPTKSTGDSQAAKTPPDLSAVPLSINSSTGQAPSFAASSMDRVVAQISAEATSSSTDSLASYAAQSANERSTLISDWMMQHIEDDGFMTLCEDVLGCWQRIGLGL